jgi:putative flippase GtrA
MSRAAYHVREQAQSAAIGRVREVLRSPRARVLRFICVGGLATLAQLGLLALFTAHRWEAVRANALALALAAQVNFSLNAAFTWGDTWGDGHRAGPVALWRRLRLVAVRWLRFMGAILGTTLLNEGLYTGALRFLPALLAAVLCSGAIAALSFAIGDRLVFTRSRANDLQAQGVFP